MNFILGEIYKLRKGVPMIIDYKNSNRYRLVAIEPNGTKTAYYFTSPIYNRSTRKMIDMKFHAKGNIAYAMGSNANLTIGSNIRMENSEGFCIISLAGPISRIAETEIVCANERLYNTTNGIAIRRLYKDGEAYTFSIESSKPFSDVRSNDKYFALMSESFRPFVVISCIGILDGNGNIISPAKISYRKITDKKYTISVTSCSSFGESVLIEANLYEPKLFQDTTVESKNPKTNNVFGGVGFIGNTKEFGKQWLYSRVDASKIDHLENKTINKATWYIPTLNDTVLDLSVNEPLSRFCSFGTNWNNKKSGNQKLKTTEKISGYYKLDITDVISRNKKLYTRNEGFILRSTKKCDEFTVISTGDSLYSPQILEINFK